MKFRDCAAFNLTSRQLDVIRWLAAGKTHEEIAQLIGGVTRQTVANDVHTACDLTGTKNSPGLVAFALRRKLIE